MPLLQPPDARAADERRSDRPRLWRRLCARGVDLVVHMLLMAVLLGWVAATVLPGAAALISRPGGEFLFGMAVLPCALALELLVQATFGTTPGKALFGLALRVRAAGGDAAAPPGARALLARQGGVYVQGLGLGIPLVGVATLGYQLVRLRRGHPASWDARSGVEVCQVVPGRLGLVRAAAAIGLVVTVVWLHMGIRGLDADYQAVISDAEVSSRALSAPTSAGAVLRVADRGSWLNPWTGRTVRASQGWVRVALPPSAAGPVDMSGWGVFHAAECGCTLLMFKASGADNLSTPEHARAWMAAQSQTFVLGELQRLDVLPGRRGWTARGVRAASPSEQVDVAFLEHGEDVWMLIASWPADTLQAMSRIDGMRQALLASLP